MFVIRVPAAIFILFPFAGCEVPNPTLAWQQVFALGENFSFNILLILLIKIHGLLVWQLVLYRDYKHLRHFYEHHIC